MPSRCASAADCGWMTVPFRRSSPASAGWTPVSTLMSVDLPAPFCPMTACTSPANRRKSTPESARTPVKRRVSPRASSTTDEAKPATFSVLAVRELLRRDVHREDALLGDDPLGQRLAGLEVLHRLHQLRPEQRAALDADVELAGHHRLERALHAVDRDDDDVLPRLQARFLDRLDRADRHVVVVRVEDVDLLALGLQERLHHLLALGAGEVAGLRADDLVARLRLDDLLEALLAVDRRCGPDRALQLDDVDVALAFVVLQQPATGLAAFLDEVRAHERDPQAAVLLVDGAVGQDHRDVRRLGFAQHRAPA